jgi:hypothetical protein
LLLIQAGTAKERLQVPWGDPGKAQPLRAGIRVREQLEDAGLSVRLPCIRHHASDNLPEEAAILHHVALEGVYLTLYAQIPSDRQDEHRHCQNNKHKFERELHGQHHLPQRLCAIGQPVDNTRFSLSLWCKFDTRDWRETSDPTPARTLLYIYAIFIENAPPAGQSTVADPWEEITMDDNLRIAEAVRQACLAAALQAYEDAGVSGLCEVGRWEYVIDTLRHLELRTIVQQIERRAAV